MTEVLLLKDEHNIDACLDKYFGKKVALQKTPQGMPYIKNNPKKISITHKDNYIVVAVSDKAVGVDLERICEKASHKSIAKRFFSHKERDYVTTSKKFFELWTRKEALGKLLGIGLNTDIIKVEVIEDCIVYADKTLCISSFFDVIAGYCLTVVSEEKQIKFLDFY